MDNFVNSLQVLLGGELCWVAYFDWPIKRRWRIFKIVKSDLTRFTKHEYFSQNHDCFAKTKTFAITNKKRYGPEQRLPYGTWELFAFKRYRYGNPKDSCSISYSRAYRYLLIAVAAALPGGVQKLTETMEDQLI